MPAEPAGSAPPKVPDLAADEQVAAVPHAAPARASSVGALGRQLGELLGPVGEGGPLTIRELREAGRVPPDALPKAFRPLLSEALGFYVPNRFDFSRLPGLTEAGEQALRQYLHPEFVRQPHEVKAQVLEALEPYLLPGAIEALRRLHLPLRLDLDGPPLTFSLEAEMNVEILHILRYFGPDPEGRIPPQAFTPEVVRLVEKLLARKAKKAGVEPAPPVDEAALAALRWSELPDPIRIAVIRELWLQDPSKVDVRLFEAEEKRFPPSLSRSLKWEAVNPRFRSPEQVRQNAGRYAELTTDGYYESLDQLVSDIGFLRQLLGRKFGLHVHVVAALDEGSARELGPHYVGMVALQDLALFARATRMAGDVFRHTSLKPWKAEAVRDAVETLASGRVELDHGPEKRHKHHYAAARTEIYGDAWCLGGEIRGVMDEAALDELFGVVDRFADALASGQVRAIPAPPWPGWDAGDPRLPAGREAMALADPAFREAAAAAGIDLSAPRVGFEELFRLAAQGDNGLGPGADDPFRLAAPLWSYECLPGLTAGERERIAESQREWLLALFAHGRSLAEARGRGEEPQAAETWGFLERKATRFFSATELDLMIERFLGEACGGH